jgi:signal transduction histidine kinase
MWTLPRSDLKFRLTLRVVAVSAICFAAVSAYVLFDADRSARARIEAIAGITAKDLELQLSKMDWVKGQPSTFPDLQIIATSLMAPGLCIAYRGDKGDILQRVCGGKRPGDAHPPEIFASLYRSLFDPGREAAQPVIFQDRRLGEAVAWFDPATLTAGAWREASHLLAVMVVTLLLLCGLVYAALARALRPTRLIHAGLARIAANDLTTRLPPFDLAELSPIREVFNHLAESLDRTLAERNELTRRLIALQDEERRHLARELHDEFGQSLTAIRALAASASQTAARDCPSLLPECEGIAKTAARMMETLRGTLFRLRPPDVEELGLAASLEGLVAGWNARSAGRTRFEIHFRGALGNLPAELSTGLYRIAQEAITNTAKHAEARRVMLALAMREGGPSPGAPGKMEIELTVEDDGKPGVRDPAMRSGMGLLGMRERVASLGGRLSFEAGRNTGSILRVAIPVAPAAACEPEKELTA